jgi:hypothetical protein
MDCRSKHKRSFHFDFSTFFYIRTTFLSSTVLLSELAQLPLSDHRLGLCQYSSFSPGFWDVLEAIAFTPTFFH